MPELALKCIRSVSKTELNEEDDRISTRRVWRGLGWLAKLCSEIALDIKQACLLSCAKSTNRYTIQYSCLEAVSCELCNQVAHTFCVDPDLHNSVFRPLFLLQLCSGELISLPSRGAACVWMLVDIYRCWWGRNGDISSQCFQAGALPGVHCGDSTGSSQQGRKNHLFLFCNAFIKGTYRTCCCTIKVQDNKRHEQLAICASLDGNLY